MADDVREQPRVEVERPRCPFCHEGVEAAAQKAACTACMAWHHEGCWGEGGGCAACGARAPAAPAPRPQSRPVRRPTRRAAHESEADLAGFQDSAPSAVLVHRAAEVQRRVRRARVRLGAGAAVTAVAAIAVVATLMGENGFIPIAIVAMAFAIAAVACALAGGAAWLVVRAIERAAARADAEATGPPARGGPGPG